MFQRFHQLVNTLRAGTPRRGVLSWRASVALQADPFECGFVCASQICAMFGVDNPAHLIKASFGSSARGLTVSNLKSVLVSIGCDVRAEAFDRTRLESYPSPAIALTQEGHYVVLGRVLEGRVEVFDPATGWSTRTKAALSRTLNGLALTVDHVRPREPVGDVPRFPIRELIVKHLTSKLGLQVFALSFLAAGIHIATALLTQTAVDATVHKDAMGFASMIAIAFMVITVIGSLSEHVSQYGSRLVHRVMSVHTADWTFQLLGRVAPDYFERNGAASIQAAYGAASAIQIFATEVLNRTLIAAILGAVGFIALSLISPWLLLPIFGITLISASVEWLLKRRSLEAKEGVVQANNQQRSFIYDVVSVMPVLRRFGVKDRVALGNRRRARHVGDASVREAKVSMTRDTALVANQSIERLLFVLIAGVGVQQNSLSLGFFVAAGLFREQLQTALFSVTWVWRQYSLLQVQKRQLAELMQLSNESAEPTAPPAPVQNGAVTIRAVSHRYGTFSRDTLKDVSLELSPGEYVAIQGESGSGKSTLIRLIAGASRPTEGEVLIDGTPANLEREGVASVLQTDRLISVSIRENVRFFRAGISDSDIMTALEIAGLSSFVESLPMRLDTIVGDALAGLSAGQKQRLLLARAICGKPRLLLLDEATSNLDVDTEEEIMSALRSLEITMVVCSHRPKLAETADRVFRISGGVCSELSQSTNLKTQAV